MKLTPLFLIISFLFSCDLSFADPATFNCEYSLSSDQNGSHEEKPPLSFPLLFDPKTGKFYSIGTNQASEIRSRSYHNSFDRLTIIEETQSGNLQVTLVAEDGQSVHSRHAFVGGKFLATQYYGRCSRK